MNDKKRLRVKKYQESLRPKKTVITKAKPVLTQVISEELEEKMFFLLKKIGLTPNKLMGQNFCLSEKLLEQMVALAEVKTGDKVLEVGPGLGFLTQTLLNTGANVTAVEADQQLIKLLQPLAIVQKNLTLLFGDILKIEIEKINLPVHQYKLVANLPYSISAPFFRRFLTTPELQPETITVLIQKEVAQRICATPKKGMSILAISVQAYATPEIKSLVPPAVFYPVPKVWSAILQLTKIGDFKFKKEVSEKAFFGLVKAGFSSKRKTLANNLTAWYGASGAKKQEIVKFKDDLAKKLVDLGLTESVRAENLSLEQWHDLVLWVKKLS
jgi:16S rRNA (adenine1518-N6/adenine1519-N6)-dimethyltransferase